MNKSGTITLQRTLLVWDAINSPPKGNWFTVLWSGFEEGNFTNSLSMPKLVEEHANELRARYLAWVYELGETRIHDRRVVDHFELRTGFSFWWMTLLAQKCNFAESPHIDDAIKLLAFESWAAGQSKGRVILVTSKEPLAECIRHWCVNAGILFEWQRLSNKSEPVSCLMRVYRYLPHALQAFAWLFLYMIKRWPLKGVGLREWCQSEGQVTFVSYMLNLIPDAIKNRRFESRYWGHLPDDLLRDGCKQNWLHIYVKDPILHPNARKAAGIIRMLNANGNGSQAHVTLDTFLSFRLVFKALSDFFHIRRIAYKFKNVPVADDRSLINLWPLFKADWSRSFYGREALTLILDLHLYESALKALPKQRIGLYLLENQGWEFSMIKAWRSAGHKKLIGVPHSTIRFWDLRYFFDSRSYVRTGKNDLPLPDMVATNGKAMMEAYLGGGYPVSELVVVEALRYGYLAGIAYGREPYPDIRKPILSILVVCDFLPKNNQLQMHLLERAVAALPESLRIIVKPHPAHPISSADYPKLRMEISQAALVDLLPLADVVYASSTTSAAVDAYCAGIPVICVLDPASLNLSPLRGKLGVSFASTPEELASMLFCAYDAPFFTGRSQDFFTLDQELPLWRALLLETTSGL